MIHDHYLLIFYPSLCGHDPTDFGSAVNRIFGFINVTFYRLKNEWNRVLAAKIDNSRGWPVWACVIRVGLVFVI